MSFHKEDLALEADSWDASGMAATVTGRRLELAIESAKPRTVLSFDRHGDLIEVPAPHAELRLEARRPPKAAR